ncbi:density-regulated protein-like [Amphiura filiformis]|uniref:density-regulated protein-like n=1 Tax=Amphiura filiformis TaxID=82378 RepID=UPI003B217089
MAEADVAAERGEGDGAETAPKLGGKKPGVTYPLKVLYCGECSMPPEYCEYYPGYEQCKAWLEKNCPDLLEQLTMDDTEDGDGKKKSKAQKRGGRGVIKTKKKSEPQKVTINRVTRNKRKYVTVIRGLSTHDIDLRKASKAFSNKFSCGASVTGDDEIVIQGDVTYDLIDFIPEHWPEIDEDAIEDLGDMKR